MPCSVVVPLLDVFNVFIGEGNGFSHVVCTSEHDISHHYIENSVLRFESGAVGQAAEFPFLIAPKVDAFFIERGKIFRKI